MGNTSENKPDKYKKHICLGILAHVDAGKTTLSESILYLTGRIRKLGRVDHKDAFLDTNELERARGITIFSKQAVFPLQDIQVTLLDTPGHVDFSAEMERTLQVLDYAVLVISGADGVQGHTETLWKLLHRYGIPVFLFVNKMDQEGTDKERLMASLRDRLDEACIDFDEKQDREVFFENLAMCDEKVLEKYLESGEVEKEEISELIRRRKVFPCYFGSALKVTGVDELLCGLYEYMKVRSYPREFGGKVYKIARDEQGTRLTYMKITGGSLKVKTVLSGKDKQNQEEWNEKVNQIRIYSGDKFETSNEVYAGTVCAVTGLTHTYPGQGLGIEEESDMPVLEPVLTYRIILPPECDVHVMLMKLRQLEEEEPQLHIVWNEQLGEIHAQLMGEVQIEILQSLIRERFGVEAEFGTGNIMYKESILEPVEGIGHFEPLRHYAEVHLLLEPGERGSGMQFAADCSEDVLDGNWQRLILTHLEEREHIGVLTGSPITDMKITLITGRAHLKHTEGGDFRQATYRAVRQGLMKAKSVLLEPYYEYRLEVPSEGIGRALTDIQRMQGTFEPPVQEGDMSVLTGRAPVAQMRDYQKEVHAYTGGRGRLFCTLKGYEPCQNEEEVIERIGYDAQRDTENPTDSVFCAHGAGFVVPWNQVEDYMHLESGIKIPHAEEKTEIEAAEYIPSSVKGSVSASWTDDKELQEIFARTYGNSSAERRKWTRSSASPARGNGQKGTRQKKSGREVPEEEYLLVDGYNIIFAWEELKELADVNIDGARQKLMDILSNYQGFKKCVLILVFDAYKLEGYPGEVQKYHNIYVVYTKEAETADQYIEKTVHEIGKRYRVTVATSDRLEQVIILGQGASRLSARELKEEIENTNNQIRGEYLQKPKSNKNYLFSHLDEKTAELMEEVRLGKKDLE